MLIQKLFRFGVVNISVLVLLDALLRPALVFASDAKSYVVKNGDTLSKIAAIQFGGPVFRPGGSIEKILELNPDITNPHLIFIDRVIVLEPQKIQSEEVTPIQEKFETTKSINSPFAPNYKMGIAIVNSYTNLDWRDPVNEVSGQILSDLNYGGEIRVSKLLSSEFEIGSSLEVLQLRLRNTLTNQLNGQNQTLYGLGISSIYSGFDKIHFSAGLKYQYYPQLRTTATQIYVESAAIPVMTLASRVDLFRFKTTNFGFEMTGLVYGTGVLLNSNSKISLGYNTKVYLEQHFYRSKISSAIDFADRDVEYKSGLKLDQKTVGVTVSGTVEFE